MPGLSYAARRFVIVSPVCEWKWRETPASWVNDLVRCLRCASWIDHDRVYLTGYSMGGMSTWMLAADAPDLYAAIAPTAAHHHPSQTEVIAQRLKDTPILVAHSKNDRTCPLDAEQRLWERLHAWGNSKLHVHLCIHDHSHVFDRSYRDTHYVFDWLLNFALRPPRRFRVLHPPMRFRLRVYSQVSTLLQWRKVVVLDNSVVSARAVVFFLCAGGRVRRRGLPGCIASGASRYMRAR